jgi:hypothetical protein
LLRVARSLARSLDRSPRAWRVALDCCRASRNVPAPPTAVLYWSSPRAAVLSLALRRALKLNSFSAFALLWICLCVRLRCAGTTRTSSTAAVGPAAARTWPAADKPCAAPPFSCGRTCARAAGTSRPATPGAPPARARVATTRSSMRQFIIFRTSCPRDNQSFALHTPPPQHQGVTSSLLVHASLAGRAAAKSRCGVRRNKLLEIFRNKISGRQKRCARTHGESKRAVAVQRSSCARRQHPPPESAATPRWKEGLSCKHPLHTMPAACRSSRSIDRGRRRPRLTSRVRAARPGSAPSGESWG